MGGRTTERGDRFLRVCSSGDLSVAARSEGERARLACAALTERYRPAAPSRAQARATSFSLDQRQRSSPTWVRWLPEALVRPAALAGAVSHALALRICDPVCPCRVRTTRRCCPACPAVAHRESKTSDIPHQQLGGNAPRPRMAGR